MFDTITSKHQPMEKRHSFTSVFCFPTQLWTEQRDAAIGKTNMKKTKKKKMKFTKVSRSEKIAGNRVVRWNKILAKFLNVFCFSLVGFSSSCWIGWKFLFKSNLLSSLFVQTHVFLTPYHSHTCFVFSLRMLAFPFFLIYSISFRLVIEPLRPWKIQKFTLRTHAQLFVVVWNYFSILFLLPNSKKLYVSAI